MQTEIRISYVNEVKAVGRYRKTGKAPVLALNDICKSIHIDIALACFNHGTDNRPDHIPKEAVGLYGECDLSFGIMPHCLHNMAFIGLHVRMEFAETCEIGIFHKLAGGMVHGDNIQRT